MADLQPTKNPENPPPGEQPKNPTTDAELLTVARDRLKRCMDDHMDERQKQRDDLLFCTLNQWPDEIRSRRENDPNGARPCLTIDKINQYIVQVVNDMRQNRPSVKVRPVDSGADVKTAEVLQGVTRNIEDQSVAQIPYMTAGESAVRVGEGYFRILTEYESERSFNQVIRIKRIPDMFCVFLGAHIMPTGEDCDHGFVFEDIPVLDFRRMYPKAKYMATDFEGLSDYKDYWPNEPKVRVAEYFYAEYGDMEKLLHLSDGSVILEKDWKKNDALTVTGERETRERKMKWCKLTGADILQKRDWPGRWVPIIKVTGKEAWVNNKRMLWGLVRPAKDSLRMYNYWASVITEKIALAPKTPYVGAQGQFEGLEDRWRQANSMNYSYLEYKPTDLNGQLLPPPQRVQPAPIEVAMVQQLQQINADVQASLGMFKASLGQEQPNQSGKAILALTRESDTGTYHFADNMAQSIQFCGRQLIDLVPKIYDTQRVMKIMGEDGKVSEVAIDPNQPQAVLETKDAAGAIKSIYNLGIGTYDVTATVGPSYATKRMEAATLFTDLSNSAKDPISAAVVRYWAIKNADFEGSDKAAEMMGKLLPPGLLPKEGQPEIPPEVQQKLQMMEQAGNELVARNQELESGAQQEQAKIAAKHDIEEKDLIAKHDLRMRELEQEREANERQAALDEEKARRELELKEYVAKEELRIAEQKAGAECAIKENMANKDAEIKRVSMENDAKLKKEKQESESEAESGEKSNDKALNETLKALTVAIKDLAKPKQVTLTKDSNGRPVGGTVRALNS